MSDDSMRLVCCQEKYIDGELSVRTDGEVVGGTRVRRCKFGNGSGQGVGADGWCELSGGDA
jgi:hypothetical protein